MRRFLLLWCVLLVTQVALAQQIITGTVTAESDGSALPGLTVLIKGTTKGTATDADGKYSISASSGDVLQFSFIGYETQEVSVGSQSIIDMRMAASVSTLSEVVVIGFGEREKKDLTGSIATVGSKDLEQSLFASPQFALQGKAPGVRVVNSSGNPSDGPQIFVRGVGTWNGSSQPLYVVDGQIITPPSNGNQDVIGSINLWTMVNPNDIESMSVLKDASATAVYGSRAANGVVLITTKKGKKGTPSIEFNAQYGIQNIPSFKMLNPNQAIQLSREAYTNSADPNVNIGEDLYGTNAANEGQLLTNYAPQLDPSNSQWYIGENPTGYDWQKGIKNNNAVNQNYSIKLSGGTDAVDYYTSFGYNKQESVIKGNDLERFNFATNVNTKINKFIRAGVNYKLTYQVSDDNRQMNLQDAAEAPPWQPLFDPTNEYGAAPVRRMRDPVSGAIDPLKLYGVQTRNNPIGLMNANFNDFTLLRNLGQGYITIEPIKGLTFRGGISLDYTYQQRQSFTNKLQDQFLNSGGTSGPATSFGNFGQRTNKFFNYQADFTASYVKTFAEKHNINITGVIQDQYFKNNTEDFSTRNVQTRDRDRMIIPGGQNPGDQGGFTAKAAKYWYSYVGRIGYNYNSKYYLDLTGRRDASNGFPKDFRWANFYSVAAAWRLSEESFLKPVTFINDLKLRLGWGTAGNDEAAAGQFAYLSKVTDAGSYAFGSGNGDPLGIYNVGSAVYDFATPDLKWETVTTTNVGIDAVLWNNKLNVTVDLFNRLTSDILQTTALPLIVGTNNPLRNIGSAVNRGLELQVGYNNRIGDLTYGISGNISFLHNEVKSLYDHAPIFINRNGVDYRVEEGQPIGAIYGYQVGGIFQTQAEIDQYYATTPDNTANVQQSFIRPGDMYFSDVHGDPTADEKFYSKTPDGKITASDQIVLGKTIPGYTYGLNLNGGYKGFDLTVSFYGEGDVQKINAARRGMESMNGAPMNKLASTLDRWTTENPSTEMPRAVVGDPAQNDRLSSRWVENASFFRLNNWQLGYSLPTPITQRMQMNRLRVFIGGQNNMLITRWSTIDPVNDQYPLPRTYFLGLNATF